MIGDLAGRHIVVTGAAGGIGMATALRLGQLGAKVTVSDLHLSNLEAALEATGARAAIPADVTDEDSVADLSARVEAEVGRVSGVVNNAGIIEILAGTSRQTLKDLICPPMRSPA